MKKEKKIFIFIAVLLIVLCGILAKEIASNAKKQNVIDETFKDCYISILNTMQYSFDDNALNDVTKEQLMARDIGYGHILHGTYLFTSYTGNQDFYRICILMDEVTGTDAIYSIEITKELYDNLLAIYENEFEDEVLLKETRILFEKCIIK